jgi:tRNA (cytidine/uridine-2'-O-)-methyltransferase
MVSKKVSTTKISSLERHVVLVSPEIHWNTGNIGRTCLATGTILHLIKPLGFSLETREVKRAGLDYWQHVLLHVWENFDQFISAINPQREEIAIFSKKGRESFWKMASPPRLFLIFGSETKGLPDGIFQTYIHTSYYIPIFAETRSLNLSTAVGVALYESLRLSKPFHAWKPYQTTNKTEE